MGPEARGVGMMPPGRRVYRGDRGAFLNLKRALLHLALADLLFQAREVSPGAVQSRGNGGFICDKCVVGPLVLGVSEVGGSFRRLSLCVLDALFHIVEGDLEHLLFDGGGDGVPEGGKRTHVRRWSGKSGGDRGAGALVPGVVESGMGSRAEEKWGRGWDRLRIRSGRG